MFNRILGIIAVVFLGVILLRAEMRMDQIEEKLDDIIQTTDRVKYTPKDVECLTKNIYYEAGVEDHRGKYAVAHVTVNRLKAGYWGKTICQVVYAKAQFSWIKSYPDQTAVYGQNPKPLPVVCCQAIVFVDYKKVYITMPHISRTRSG